MIILAICWFGFVIGMTINIAWWSIDCLAGTSTLTPDKGVAVIGLCTVLVAMWAGAMMVISEVWLGSDRQPRAGHQPKGDGLRGEPPHKGSGGRRP
jgi:hypothetical protein